MSNEVANVYVVLDLPKTDKALLIFAKAVLAKVTVSDYLPNPTPKLWVLSDDIDAFAEAQTNAATRAKGTVVARNAWRVRLKADLHHLRDYVQTTIESLSADVDPAEVAASAFMRLKRRAKRNKAPFSATRGLVSGTAMLVAKRAVQGATYYWEYSLDQLTWTLAAETMQASTEIAGLTPGQVYYFRFRTLTRKGKGDYSQTVSLMVV